MNLFEYTLRTMAYAIADPRLVFVLVLLGFLLYKKNRKIVILQRMMVGEKVISPLELTLSEVVMGILGGLIGSMILSYLGVMFNIGAGIELIFFMSLFLLVLKPRWVSFSYSAAILGGVTLILGWLENLEIISLGFTVKLDIGTLVALVGVLTIVEGLLILVDGYRGSIPIFTNKDGKLAGGFSLERYWPVPIVIMIFTTEAISGGGSAILTPSWWPVIKGGINISLLSAAIVSAVPIYSTIGYKQITFTQSKVSKIAFSSLLKILYGIILLLIYKLANYGAIFQGLLLIFMPLAQEGMRLIENYRENKGTMKYVSDEEGITILDVMPNSPAQKQGIKSGDKILEVNDDRPDEYTMIYESINKNLADLKLKIKDKKGKIKDIRFHINNGQNTMGMILIPRGIPKGVGVVEVSETKLKDIVEKIKKNRDDK